MQGFRGSGEGQLAEYAESLISGYQTIKYFAVEYETRLVTNQKYLLFGSPGFADIAIFPIETDHGALTRILPSLYPVEGNPLNPSDNGSYNQWYSRYKSKERVIEVDQEAIDRKVRQQNLRNQAQEPPM